MSAARIFLAGLDDYQIELERKIRQTTEIPIRIGKLEAGMRGFNPEVILREISVEAANRQSKPDIHLREIRLGIDFLDLLLTRDWRSSSRVTLVGAKVSIIRNTDGGFLIKGLHASDEQPFWLLQGGKYEILDSEISWQDLKRHGDTVSFDHFDLVLKNHYDDHRHEIHMASNLPQQYGDSLRISALVTGNLFEGKDIGGQLYFEGTDLQASALIKGDLPFGLNLQSGAGDIRLWSLWRNSSPYQIDGYIQAQQISISKDQAAPLRMDTFRANFSWSDNDGRWRLAGYDVDIFTHKQHWPDGAFYLQQDAQGNLSAIVKQLDLPAAMFLAPLIVPLQHAYADWLKLNPSGHLSDVSLFVSNDLLNYAARGRFEGLSVESFGSIPQIHNLSGEISATDSYGQIIFDTHNAFANVGELFRNPIDITRLQGSVNWWQSDDAWQFVSRNLAADSADFKTSSDLNLLIPKTDASPILNMRTTFGGFNDISQAFKYLPAKIMNDGAVAWLDDAFIAGQVRQGEMVIMGALDQFPFAEGQGRFETVFTIQNGELQFNEDWPHLYDLYADVQFLGEDLQVAILHGRSEKVEIEQALVTIPELADSEYVYVWGQVRSNIMNSLAFLQKSPLRPKIDPIAQLINAKGDTDVDLELKIPYELNDPINVAVDAHLNGAELILKPVSLKVENIKGTLNFTEDRVASSPIDARTLGYPVRGKLTSDDNATYLNIDGVSNIQRLEKQFSFLNNDAADGEFSYHALLTLPYSSDQASSLLITSALLGVTVKSQTGLAKSALNETPFRLDFQLDNQPLMPLQLQYGKQLQAFLLVDKQREALYSGNIVIGTGPTAARYADVGLKIQISQPSFNLTESMGAFASDNQAKLPPLKEISIETDQLIWHEHELGALTCHMRHLKQAWQGHVDSAIAKGQFQIPDDLGGDREIRLDMDYLNLSALDKLNLESADEHVTDFPLIAVNSRSLTWRSVDLGHLRLQTDRLPNGIHFRTVQIENNDGRIDINGDWLKSPAGTNTRIKGSLKMQDFGRLLSRLGFSDDIKETSADINFRGGWTGAPHQFSMDRLNGKLNISLKDGSISSIEPGFGRLLGLIAMEQWVKRLSLDFSDIYREGLAFDEIHGNFKIKNGLAFTDDLTIDAVAATFNIAGFANLVDKTVDQRVAVIPKSSDAVPIAGTIVGGIAGIITEVVTGNYKEGYFLGSQYQLTGNWSDVKVTPLHEEDGLLNKTWRGLTDFDWLDSITE